MRRLLIFALFATLVANVSAQTAFEIGQITIEKSESSKDEKGKPLESLDRPGKKVSLEHGLATWQKDLKEYGFNQGFTIK